MSYGQVAALILPALALLWTAALEVASRSASRLDIHRWVQRTIGSDDESRTWELVDETVTSIRLARQLALVLVVVAVAAIGPQWFGLVEAGGRRLAVSAGLALIVWVLVDKLLAFALVAALGPMRVLELARLSISLLRAVFGRTARKLNQFQRASRDRDETEVDDADDRDLEALLDMAEEEGLVSAQDEALLRGVAEFREVLVDHVMTPRVDIVSIVETSTLRDLSAVVAEHKHSRIPVVRDNIDEVVGIVNTRALVGALEEMGADAPIGGIVRPTLFVPETKRVRELLREFQERREHLAIVVDEHGGTAGLVTLEDLLEEIVGEIQDELEDDKQTVVRLPDGALEADGKAEIEDIEAMLDVEIGDNEFETIGGMAFVHLGYVPKAGEAFERDGLHVEVLEADDRRVHRVRITAMKGEG